MQARARARECVLGLGWVCRERRSSSGQELRAACLLLAASDAQLRAAGKCRGGAGGAAAVGAGQGKAEQAGSGEPAPIPTVRLPRVPEPGRQRPEWLGREHTVLWQVECCTGPHAHSPAAALHSLASAAACRTDPWVRLRAGPRGTPARLHAGRREQVAWARALLPPGPTASAQAYTAVAACPEGHAQM